MTESMNQGSRLVAGRYRLGAALGRGGMGAVWRADDELLGREVAVKEVLLPPGLPEAEKAVLRERTLREARTAARINHPSVVKIYDVVQDGGRPWLVMELVDSVSLSDMVRREGALPPERVAAIGLDMLGALEAAHRAGVLHRDVKPSNVLLATDGRTVLTDFGIATLEGDSQLTSTGLVVGSPEYIAPERARGEPPGPEADLWSLGATLYAAVEGRSPYVRSGPIPTLSAVMTDAPDPMSRAGALTPVLGGLLVKDPKARMQEPRVRELLEGVVAGRTIGAAYLGGGSGSATATVASPPRAPSGPGMFPPPGSLPPPGPSRPTTPPGSWPPIVAPRSPTTSAPSAYRSGGLGTAGRNTSRPTTSAPSAFGTDGGTPPLRIGPPQGKQPGGFLTQAPQEPHRRAKWPIAVIAAVVVIAVVVAVVLLRMHKNNKDAGAATTAGVTTTSGATTSSASTIPAGWQLHRDPTGYQIALPSDWTSMSSNTPDTEYFAAPDPRIQVIVQWGLEPAADPVSNERQRSEKLAQAEPDYQQIGQIPRVTYDGYSSADLEFVYYIPSQQLTRHGLERYVVVRPPASNGAGLAYTIELLAPRQQWQQAYSDFWQGFLDSFQPGNPTS